MLVMEMSNKKQQIPAIRFNGFTDAWEQRKFFDNIQNTIDFRGRTPKKLGMDWSESGYLALSALNVKNGYIDPSADAHYGDGELYKKWMGGRELRKGQVLFTTEAPMGNVAQVPDNQGYILSQRTITFDVNDEKITDDFLAVLLRSPNVFNDLSALASGGTAKGVSQKSLSGLKVIVPRNLCEQEKIGLFFKQLDSAIALHQRQVNNYKLLKNSLIQQMFPQGGEQLPKMRFAGFSGEWVRKKLGEFVEINRGLTYKPEDVVSDGIRVLRSSNIKQDIFELRADDVFVRHDAANIPEIKNGDILVTSANGSTALVGKHAIVDKLSSKTVHGGFMLVIRCEHNYFINTWMSSSEYKRVLQLVQGGNGAIGNLSKKVLEEAVIAIPSDEEQTKIGNFFKKLDDNITFHQQKTDDYQQLKKVLLQQMFL